MMVQKLVATLVVAFLVASPARAQDALVTYKSLSPELALDLARASLAECRKRGYQAAVAVVDRFGVTQVLLRDRFAGAHTASTAAGKAWTAASFRTSTTDLVAITQPGMPQAAVRNCPAWSSSAVACWSRLAAQSSARSACFGRAGRRRRRGLRQGRHRGGARQAGVLTGIPVPAIHNPL